MILKKRTLLLSFFIMLFGSLQLFSQPKVAATVISVKGEAYAQALTDKSRLNLGAGARIFMGSKIVTGKNSEVVLQMADGTRRIVPANSELVIGEKENIQIKSLLERKIDSLTAFVGLKAAGEETIWYQKDTERFKKIKKSFEAADYAAVIRLAEEKESLEGAEYLYMTGVAYLKLNITMQAVNYFKKAIAKGSPQVKRAALKGAFLSYLKQGNKQVAEKILKDLRKEKEYKELKELLK